MTVDRNDGYAKVINALTGAIVAFRNNDEGHLHDEAKDAMESVLREVGWRTLGEVSSLKGEHPEELADERTPLIPWMPVVRRVNANGADEDGEWMLVLDDVDLGQRFDNESDSLIALWAVDAAINRMRKYSRSAAESFYRENAG